MLLQDDLAKNFSQYQREHIIELRMDKSAIEGVRLSTILNNLAQLKDIAWALTEHTPNEMAKLIAWFYDIFGKEDAQLMYDKICKQLQSFSIDTYYQILDALHEIHRDDIRNLITTKLSMSPLNPSTTDTSVKVSDDPDAGNMLTTLLTATRPTPMDLDSSEEPETTAGSGYLGWRAPRLHRLVRPYRPFTLTETPEEIVDEEKHDLDERRTMYKDQQLFQRGLAPPKDMVDRAMPKTAKPYLHNPLSIHFTGVIPHPFVFPDKKYFVQPGL